MGSLLLLNRGKFALRHVYRPQCAVGVKLLAVDAVDGFANAPILDVWRADVVWALFGVLFNNLILGVCCGYNVSIVG